MVNVCLPAALLIEAFSMLLPDKATCLPSMYAFMVVMGRFNPLAVAEMRTGEPTVVPLAGEHTLIPALRGKGHELFLKMCNVSSASVTTAKSSRPSPLKSATDAECGELFAPIEK